MASPAPTVLHLWWYNPVARRFELMERNPNDPPGVGRIVAVHAGRSSVMTDLPQGVSVTPLSDDLEALIAAYGTDPNAGPQLSQAADALNTNARQQGLNIASVGTPPAQQTPNNGGLLMDLDRRNALTERTNTVLSGRERQNAIQGTEDRIRAEMAGYGFGAQQQADFFNRYQLPQAGAGESSQYATGLQLPAGEIRAQTNQDATAIRGNQIAQQERLRQIEAAWNAHKEGADRLQKFGDVRRSRDQLAQQTELDEQRLRADPNQDKNLRPLVGGQWGYNQTAGAHQQMADYDQALTSYLQQNDPAGYAFEQQRRRDYEQGGWLPEGVRRQIPRFAGGGEFYHHDQQSSPYGQSSPLGEYQPPQWDATNNNWGNPQQNATQDAYRQQAFANESEQRDVSEQLNRIQQQRDFQAQQMQAAHQQRMAELNQRYSLLQTEIQRQQSQYSQQQAMAQGEYGLMSLPARGQTWAG